MADAKKTTSPQSKGAGDLPGAETQAQVDTVNAAAKPGPFVPPKLLTPKEAADRAIPTDPKFNGPAGFAPQVGQPAIDAAPPEGNAAVPRLEKPQAPPESGTTVDKDGGTTTVTTDGVTNVKDAAGVVTSSTPPGLNDPHK
jgi:hypothetical protein